MARKHLLATLAAVSVFGMAGTAYADTVYTYHTAQGTYSIDATNNTGTWTSTTGNPTGSLSFSFTVAGGGTFTGGTNNTQQLALSNMAGAANWGGTTYYPVNGDPTHVIAGMAPTGGVLDLSSKLWVAWGTLAMVAARSGYVYSDIGWTCDTAAQGGCYTPPPPPTTTTGGTTTGGTTTGGTTTGGTTTGGTTTGGTTTGGTTTGGTTTGGTTTGGTTTGGTAVPEPANLALFGLGAAALMFARRRNMRVKAA